MQENNWKPTEEELVSLGFKKREMPDTYKMEFNSHWDYLWFGYETGFWISDRNWVPSIYPKSLEELHLLISMMRP